MNFRPLDPRLLVGSTSPTCLLNSQTSGGTYIAVARGVEHLGVEPKIGVPQNGW